MHRPICFVWQQFAAYHSDRCEAVGRAYRDIANVVGIEIAPKSDLYDWAPALDGESYEKITLFPNGNASSLSAWSLFYGLYRTLRKIRPGTIFICGYQRAPLFFVALLMSLGGTRIVVMNDARFDDKPRYLFKELFKYFLMRPYSSGLASGSRAADYMRFLGVRGPIAIGYDTVSHTRLRALAGATEATCDSSAPFLIVARLVHKKNLTLAVHAFALFLRDNPTASNRLRICGSGPDRMKLELLASELGVSERIDFLGSLSQAKIAIELAGAMCLLLPSIEEQWGLVVNEALAFGLPFLVSQHVGACDSLIVNLHNGYILTTGDPEVWATAMSELLKRPDLRHRMCSASKALAPKADVGAFVNAVQQLIGE